ncbi:MAG: Vps62-related protein [Ilumatobacteraceae bacterium]
MNLKSVVLAALAAAVVAMLVPMAPASAQESSTDDAAQELVEKYAPIIMLKAQEAACDVNGEPYAPTSVDIVLDNPEILLRQLGNGNPVVKQAPSAADLYGLNEGFYLDFPASALQPGCIYERDFDKYTGTTTGHRETTVYAHIATQADEPDKLAVQYWFYWYFNDWNNKHESDWEGIQLMFDVGTVEEALTTEPVSTGYAQHEGGERADWDSSKLTREGDRPVVYPSAGSHATYYGSALYIGRSASEGFGCDTTDGPSVRSDPAVVLLPDAASGPDDELAWLDYNGRWGERQSGPFNGPTGPEDKERWANPVDWHDSLRSGSAVVPAGDSQGDSIVNTFCNVVEVGSGALIKLKTSPLSLVIAVGVLVVLLRWVVGRTVWNKVPAIPMIRRRRAGEIVRAAAGSYRRRVGVLVTIGLVYVPTSIVVALSASALRALPLVRSLTDISGSAAETSMFFALVAGSLANLLAFIAVNAMVAAYYDLLSDGDGDASGLDAVRRAWKHAPELFVGFLRAFAIVTLLALTVVGVPVAIWYLIRVQFMAQAVVTEDLDGASALRRSSSLVTGRWWHTAVMVTLINALVGLSGLVVGLLLLVLVAGIPLWLFSGFITLVYALIAPLAAVAMTLLFGDAVAESRGETAPEPGVEPTPKTTTGAVPDVMSGTAPV